MLVSVVGCGETSNFVGNMPDEGGSGGTKSDGGTTGGGTTSRAGTSSGGVTSHAGTGSGGTTPSGGTTQSGGTSAGGTTPNANFAKAQVQRNGRAVLDKGSLQQAMAQGQTLDESGLRDGDQLNIPKRSTGLFTDNLRLFSLLIGTTVGIYTLTRHH